LRALGERLESQRQATRYCATALLRYCATALMAGRISDFCS
jgi:hypothetical protein